jgi:hypothetical protein
MQDNTVLLWNPAAERPTLRASCRLSYPTPPQLEPSEYHACTGLSPPGVRMLVENGRLDAIARDQKPTAHWACNLSADVARAR